jgi:hypothetical protein
MPDDEIFWRLGAWELLFHDHGWILAFHRVVRLEGRWPTWRTFHHG